MTVYVKNAEGISVPQDSNTEVVDTTTTTTNTAKPTVTNPTKIGSWSLLDRIIPSTMDYSPFTYRKGTNYRNVLGSSYGIGKNPVSGLPIGMGGSQSTSLMSGLTYDSSGTSPLISSGMGSNTPGAEYGEGSFYANPKATNAINSPVAFADEVWNQIIDEARKAINNKLYTTSGGGNSMGLGVWSQQPISRTLNNKALDVALTTNANLINPITKKAYGLPDIGVMGLSPIEAYGGSDEQKILQKIADKYNVSVSDITNKDAQLQRALNVYYDPVGSNWQDVRSSPWFTDVRNGIAAGEDATFLRNFKKQLGEDSPLEAVYFALHRRPESLGINNTSAMTAPAYKYTGWEEFLPSGVTPLTATSEQMAAAADAYAAQSKLLKPWLDPARYGQKAIDNSGGSYFDLFRSENIPIPKDYDYDPGPTLARYNMAVNAGIDPAKLGYDVNNVYKSALEEEDSGGGLFGGGGLLGTVASLASFIPGPIGTVAQFVNAANALASGDVVGGLASIAGATGLTGQITGGLSDKLLNSFPTEIASIAAKLNMSPASFANSLANAAVNAGISGAHAAAGGGDVWDAIVAGGATPLIGKAIDAQLATTISNTNLRKFITNQATTALVRAAQGKDILPFNVGSNTSSGAQTSTGTSTGTSTQPKQGDKKLVSGVEYTYQNGMWIPT